jgi:CRISPR-associated exonuclease Cas4
VVEFKRTEEEIDGVTIRLKNRKGWWRPYPVEYKRGRPKRDDRDAVQLCAQAIALEEMLNVKIDSGFLYYGQLRRRESYCF